MRPRPPGLVPALLVLASLSLMALDRSPRSGLDDVRAGAASTFGPVESAAAAARDAVAGRLGASTRDAEVARLRHENDALRRRLAGRRTEADRAGEVRRLLRTSGLEGLRVLDAQVVAVGASQSFARTVAIDAGTDDGVHAGMPVLAAAGLVGRVVRASGSVATVLLAVDATSTVGVRLLGSREIGAVAGDGTGLRLTLLDSRARLRPGDRLVTLGSSGGRPYVPGVPVGRVTQVSGGVGSPTRTGTVRPDVDPTALDVLGVVVGQTPDGG